MSELTTWKKEFEHILLETGDKLKDLIFNRKNADLVLNTEFDKSFGYQNGPGFIAWSDDYVYFNQEYDGADFISYIQRNPKKLK